MRESKLWFLFIAAGVVMIVLLAVHMAVMHLDDLMKAVGLSQGDVLSAESVAERSKDILHVILYVLLLATALFHGFYGLRSVVRELPLSKFLKDLSEVVLPTVGVIFFLWGMTAIILGYIR
ncbi:MAG: hypothetical protein RDV48_16260 [Candidatus Eremiobacteraeota bacterium]|nr:hypothetical protein [Candidatus Eremiobacteraeota bacterium]